MSHTGVLESANLILGQELFVSIGASEKWVTVLTPKVRIRPKVRIVSVVLASADAVNASLQLARLRRAFFFLSVFFVGLDGRVYLSLPEAVVHAHTTSSSSGWRSIK